MKKILSIVLVTVMVLSCLSVVAFAGSTQYYRDGIFEFYIEDGGARIVNIRIPSSPSTEVTIPLSLCWDDEKKIDAPTNASIPDDDNDAPDPFGVNYAYVTALDSTALDNYAQSITKLKVARYVEELDMDSLRAPTLQSIEVDDQNTTYASYNGTLYNAAKTKLILHPIASSDNSILSSVTSFEKYAFQDCSLVTNVTIPAGVTSIPERCFEGCTALTSIDMSAAPIGNIGNYAFLNCGLQSVTFGSKIKLINSYAFFNNASLTSVIIPQDAKNVVLKAGAFLGCPIENFKVYRSIVEIGAKAIGYYYDADLSLQKYEDMIITSYKYNADKSATNCIYDYAKSDVFKFIPLDDIFSLTYTYDQVDGYDATMYLFKGDTKKYTLKSDNGVFTATDMAAGTYEVYIVSQFGLTIKADTVKIDTADFQEEYTGSTDVYEPIGDVTRDGKINVNDIAALLTEGIYMSDNPNYDIDKDGVVGFGDTSIVLASANYGEFSESLPEDFTTPTLPL
ncbi:MAG: leucine-rich repeat protein [Clostridia bacterium]|nr:leucine-rich repeat protein [Clostridia bacterium]